MPLITWGQRQESLSALLLRGIDEIRQIRQGIAKSVVIAVPLLLLLWIGDDVSRLPLDNFPASCSASDIRTSLVTLASGAAVLYMAVVPIVWYLRRWVAAFICVTCMGAECLIRLIAHEATGMREA